ncbi:hypothetical protein ABPG75_011010 [Micractinium tetrahymenae]
MPLAEAAAALQPVLGKAFATGQGVWYRQRDGTEIEAKVESVDLTVDPPSYGVLLHGRSDARETIAERLRPREPANGSGSAANGGGPQAAAAAAAARGSERQTGTD